MAVWDIVRTKPVRKTYGRSLPAFIHNGDYFLSTVDVYADGAIDCWGFVDRDLFQKKIESGWVVTHAPVGAILGIHNFGMTRVGPSEWSLTASELRAQVEGAIHDLNPEARDLLDMQGQDSELRGKMHYAKLGLADEKPYRVTADGVEVLGEALPLFERSGEGFTLQQWFIFADGLCRIGTEGQLEPFDAISARLGRGPLRVSVPDGTSLMLPGLGRFQTVDGCWSVQAKDRVREARDLLRQLQGQPGAVECCIHAHKAYDREPTEARREELREAYEAVPKHLRMYCGDMDTKDGRIRAILRGGKRLGPGC